MHRRSTWKLLFRQSPRRRPNRGLLFCSASLWLRSPACREKDVTVSDSAGARHCTLRRLADKPHKARAHKFVRPVRRRYLEIPRLVGIQQCLCHSRFTRGCPRRSALKSSRRNDNCGAVTNDPFFETAYAISSRIDEWEKTAIMAGRSCLRVQATRLMLGSKLRVPLPLIGLPMWVYSHPL